MVINGIPSAKAAGHADCSADYPLAQTGKPGFKPVNCFFHSHTDNQYGSPKGISLFDIYIIIRD